MIFVPGLPLLLYVHSSALTQLAPVLACRPVPTYDSL